MVKLGIVGLGKMGISHHAIANSHPQIHLGAVCDSSAIVRSVLERYTGVATFSSFDSMVEAVDLDAVLIATPSRTHVDLVRTAIDRDLHVFCEKPFTLCAADSEALAVASSDRGLVTQVGYHNRFIGTFREVKRLLDSGAIGRVTHAMGEAYGPVVLKQAGQTWRNRRDEGGGCLYDYAAHPIDLLNWYLGPPTSVGGTVLGQVFSAETTDEVYATLFYPTGATGQLSVNWSDESHRKMTTRITLRGSGGRISADRQEVQVYLRAGSHAPSGYSAGWNVRYTTDLTEPVGYYLRGEEYSAQIDHFVKRIEAGNNGTNIDFAAAAATDRAIEMLSADARDGTRTSLGTDGPSVGGTVQRGFRSRRRVRQVLGVVQAATPQRVGRA